MSDGGAPDGAPIFYFHGHPGSRHDLDFIDADDAAVDVGARVIALERPGYGQSSEQPGRTLLDWPKDVAAVADALGVERFSVVGYSGGGPYALACAATLSERVSQATVVAGVGPADAPGQKNSPGWVYSRARGPVRDGLMRATAWAARVPDAMALPVARAALPKPDRQALRADARVGQGLMATWREAFRETHRGAVQDAEIYAEPWGFAPEAVAVPVVLWHGRADANVPFSVGEYVADLVQPERTEFLEDEGHLSIWTNHASTIWAAATPT